MAATSPSTLSDIIGGDISPESNDRLITCMDAKLDPACPIIPEAELDFRALDVEDQKIFLRCRPHQQRQIALIKFLRYARENPNEPPAELYRDLCWRIPSSDPKKQWACGMKGCKMGDTLEHIKTHLHGLTHFNYRFFSCPTW
jgi:hypothetical protein